jgi:hypothetical protein
VCWIGARNGWHLVGVGGVIAVTTCLVAVGTRYAEMRSFVVAGVVASAILISLLSRMVSPFLVGPGLAAITVITFAFHPALGRSADAVGRARVLRARAWLLELVGAC